MHRAAASRDRCKPVAQRPRDRARDPLAGLLKSENLSSGRLREVDENELALIEEVILTAFIDNSYEIVPGCSRIRQDAIYLAQDQGGFVASILDANRKLLCRSFHILVDVTLDLEVSPSNAVCFAPM